MALLSLASGLGWGVWTAISQQKLISGNESRTVYLAKGDGLLRLAYQLWDQRATRALWHTVITSEALGLSGRLQAGEYRITPDQTLESFLNSIVKGERIQRRLVVPEGLSSKQVAILVENSFGIEVSRPITISEGSVLPDTYFYERGETADAIISRMQTALASELERLWDQRANDLPIKSKAEAIILASIVEKETAVARERPLVAAVFINRLRQGMRLQSDPTIIYGITQGLPLGRGITRSELRTETPYNTYRINGLPPGPIANAGLDSIKAVLNPPDVPYYYFVADGSGGHAFAKTLKEHNRNVAKWRQIEKNL
ncbi:endolytic transglycosylase MltG [Kordiimonas sediminis]|uniref:endolytic transglycosylase MltG n=1 Tax=Kordiimonas sediminis TaxID=1735581 RepID=UPI00174D79A2|nr:endolytic transglycosylase MltG [Kordiimonas sediminis]